MLRTALRSLRRPVAKGVALGLLASSSWADDPLNVLLVVLDDVGTDQLRLFDEYQAPPYALTPTLDSLAMGGIRFTAYHTNPVCSSTRACLQTGRYAFRHGLGNVTERSSEGDDDFKLADSEVFLSELLRYGFAPGGSSPQYHCGIFGKWHLTYDTGSLVNGNESHAIDNGYERFRGSMGNVDDHFQWRKIEHDAGFAPSESIELVWSPTVVREDAVEWINAQTEPFLAVVAFNPPHVPYQVPPLALLQPSTLQLLNEVIPFGLAEGLVASTPTESRLFYASMLEAVDAEIGNLLYLMDPAKRAQTVVIVVSDNGTPRSIIKDPPHDRDHGKLSPYQLGIRVPMIVSGPLVPKPTPLKGRVCDEPVDAVDLWRTIAAITGASETLAFEALGIAPAPRIDSRSFLPLVQDPLARGTRLLSFGQTFAPNRLPPSPEDPTHCLAYNRRGITDGTYKYIRFQDPKFGGEFCTPPPTYTEGFYHLPTDPDEQANLLDTHHMNTHEVAILNFLRRKMTGLSGR